MGAFDWPAAPFPAAVDCISSDRPFLGAARDRGSFLDCANQIPKPAHHITPLKIGRASDGLALAQSMRLSAEELRPTFNVHTYAACLSGFASQTKGTNLPDGELADSDSASLAVLHLSASRFLMVGSTRFYRGSIPKDREPCFLFKGLFVSSLAGR